MDIKCRHCGEPIDTYEFHDIAESLNISYSDVFAKFVMYGCPGIGLKCNSDTLCDDEYRTKIDPAVDILGDDVDGIAAALDEI